MDDFYSDDFHVGAIHPRRRTPSRRPNLRRLGLALLITALMLAAGYSALEYVGSSANADATLAYLCGQLSLTRRGLPCDIPLPADATFIGSMTAVARASGQDGQSAAISETDWTFRTRQSLAQIGALYTQTLGAWCWGVDDADMIVGANPHRPGAMILIAAFQSGASVPLDSATSGPFLDQPTTSPTLLRVSLIQSGFQSGFSFTRACNAS